MNRAPTLEDVARVAGVSRATASRVVRGDVNVLPDRSAAVRRAIESLGYVPNSAARSLVTRSTGAIALIVPEPDARVFTDPFFGTAVAAISERLTDADKQLILVLSGSDVQGDRLERFVRGGHADGLLVMSHHEGGPSLQVLPHATVPVVYIGRPPTGTDSLFVDVDNVHGGRIAAERLITRGCTRIATITGPQDMGAAVDRLQGFLAALDEAGLRPARVEYGDFSATSGESAADRMLRDGAEVDAVFAANDLMAIGALRHFTAAGLRVPSDVAIVGFDDIAISGEQINALTTVANPVSRLGALGTSMLLDAIAGRRPEPLVLRDLELRERSTA